MPPIPEVAPKRGGEVTAPGRRGGLHPDHDRGASHRGPPAAFRSGRVHTFRSRDVESHGAATERKSPRHVDRTGTGAVVADAAARLADPGPVIVPPGRGREFLACQPLSSLPVSEKLLEAFRALGWTRIGQLAERERSELEARFGPTGLQAHRWVCGEDERAFDPFRSRSEGRCRWSSRVR